MAYTLGEAAAMALAQTTRARSARGRSGAPHRTGAPVRRGSIEAVTFEEAFFAVPSKGETDRLLRMARAALDAARRLRRIERSGARALTAAERRLTVLTAGAVRVYEEICTLARLNRGQVFPSYYHLARATALGRATVARALRALEAAGFLVRQRRFRRVEAGEADGGPRYKQTSNVYRPTLPGQLLALLPRWLRPAPPPADALHHRAEDVRQVATMRAGLSCRELAETMVGGALGRVLARIGARIDATSCESHDDPQPLSHPF